MVKFSAGYVPAREAHLIGLGLSDGNLALLRLGKPIRFRGEDLRLPPPGCDLVLFYGKDQDAIKAWLEETLAGSERIERVPTIPVLHVDRKFYVTPLSREDSRVMYLIGLDDVGCDYLRAGGRPAFRNRFTEGEGTSVEIILFWGESEEAMEEMFRTSGLIGPETRVTKS